MPKDDLARLAVTQVWQTVDEIQPWKARGRIIWSLAVSPTHRKGAILGLPEGLREHLRIAFPPGPRVPFALACGSHRFSRGVLADLTPREGWCQKNVPPLSSFVVR